MLLNKVDSPYDVKFFNFQALRQLCAELRESIISVISKNGGHLGASLGVVELTVALHFVFDAPTDKIIWDVGHQSYPHKLLTGRRDKFATLRQEEGLSAFLKREESVYDAFGAGHSSTSLSAALGMEVAKLLQNKSHRVIAVIGDGALTAGMAYEALNNAGSISNDLIVILNDNDMSISPTTGALSAYLKKKVSSGKAWSKLSKIFGRSQAVKKNYELFSSLGFDCVGPIDGHDLGALVCELKKIKTTKGPKLLHVRTQKGKGALNDSSKDGLHAIEPVQIRAQTPLSSSSKNITYTKVFAESLIREASVDKRLVAITAAMPSGTGLHMFQERFPNRFFDVGIAEQHAVTFAAGLACEGMSPFVAIYSTFLQRALDQIIHDVALQKLPVRFAIDRAGLVGKDGPTHAGTFDIAFLSMTPNFVVMCPSDANELSNMVHTAAGYHDGPIALRYPRGNVSGIVSDHIRKPLAIGKGILVKEGNDVAVLVLGTRMQEVLKASRALKRHHGVSITIADARFAKPIDESLVLQLLRHHKALLVVEDGSIGGFAAQVNHFIFKYDLQRNRQIKNLFLPDSFINHGPIDSLYNNCTDLNANAITEIIKQILQISNVALFPRSLDLYADVAQG